MKKTRLFYLFLGASFFLAQQAVSQTPTISGLNLSASPGNTADAVLTASYTDGASVVETASAWYSDGTPLMRLYLPFEAGTNNALLDFSGYHNDAFFSESASERPSWISAEGHNGSGVFLFDGNDYLSVANALPTYSSYTKTAWIYIDTLARGFRNIMSSVLNGPNDHHFKVDPNGKLNAGHMLGDAIVMDPDSMNHEQWYFVAVTFDFESGEMVLYRDGVEVDRAIVPESLRVVNDPNVLIGAKNYDFRWEGMIDEPRIYERALSPEQILTLYSEGDSRIGSNMIEPQETNGGQDWYVIVTPFSATQVGNIYISNTITLQGPEISGLSLNAETPANLTTEDLTASFDQNSQVVGSASAWYRNGEPENTLYLPFEAGYPNVMHDYSGSNTHVTRSVYQDSIPVWDPDGGPDHSGALVFNDNDYLLAENALPLGASYTKTAWIRISYHTFNNIMSSISFAPNNHTFKVDPDGRLTAGHSNGENIVESNTILTPLEWHFVAVSFNYESGEMILYVDGVEDISATVPLELRDVVDPSVLVGAFQFGFGFHGRIDDARIYNRVVSPELIATLWGDGDATIGKNTMVSQETRGGDEWHVDVTSFSTYGIGSTVSSNTLNIQSLIVTDIPDQTVQEGTAFDQIDLDNYVTDYEYGDAELDWTSSGSSDLMVTIDPDSHVATIAIPDAEWYGSETITFTVENPATLTATIEATFTVENINDPPVLTETGDQSTNEDVNLTGIAVTFTDADPTDTHTILIESSDLNVTVAHKSGDVSGSMYDLVPEANWFGTAEITVTVTDNGAGSLFDSETYTLTVNPVNDAPVLTATGNQSINEDGSITGIAVIFTDQDPADTHTITVESSDLNVTVEHKSGDTSGSTYDLVPAADWSGTAEITVTVTDDGTGSLFDSETYTLTVNPVNDPPTSLAISDSTIDERVETGTVIGLFTTADVDDGDTHTYRFISDGGVSDQDNTAFSIVGDTLKTNTELDFEVQSSYDIFVRVDDGNGGRIARHIIIKINDVDETAIREFNRDLLFNVYPVPAVENVTVEIDNPENKPLQLEIYSINGALVHSETIFNRNMINLSEFESGMYFLKIKGERVYGTRKMIVKER